MQKKDVIFFSFFMLNETSDQNCLVWNAAGEDKYRTKNLGVAFPIVQSQYVKEGS